MALTEAGLLDYVVTELGNGAWQVELLEKQIKNAITDTLEHYSRRLPLLGYGAVSLSTTQNKYTFPGQDFGFGIWHVSFIEPDPKPSAIFYANLLDVAPIKTGRFGDYDIFLRWRKTFMKVTSVEPEWMWDQNAQTLWIYNPIEAYKASMWWYLPKTLAQVDLVHERWVKDYLLARCKYLLGLNRSKFQGAIPGPARDITTDGNDLKSEGRDEMKRLEDQLFSMQAETPPMWD